MAKTDTVRITNRVIEKLLPGETAWDKDVAGFGIRCQRRDKVYVLKTRVKGRQRWFTIGKHGSPWTPDKARREARILLGTVADGRDPRVEKQKGAAPSLKELAEVFLREHVDSKRKPSTAILYRDYIDRLILPALGKREAAGIKHVDITKLHHDMRDTPYQANRVIAVLSKMFSFAEMRDLIPKGSNPCRGLEKYNEEARERFLTTDEITRLGDAILEAEAGSRTSPYTIAAIRLLLFTGARRGEILSLKWDYVDLERSVLFLPDSKSGRKTIQLNALAMDVIRSIPRIAGNPWVIVGRKPGEGLKEMKTAWRTIRRKAGLEDVRIHDMRHTFASIAAGAGASLYIIGKLLGHKNPTTTQRYAHLANDPLRSVGAQVAESLGAALGSNAK